MKCSDVTQTQALLYVYRELRPNEMAAVEAHLAACAGCRAHVADLQKTLTMVRHLDSPAPPAYALERLHAAARRTFVPPASWWSRLKTATQLPVFSLPRWAAVSAVTVASLVLAVGLYLSPWRALDPAALAAIENRLDTQVTALTDDVEVLEWELYESGDVAALDQQHAELDDLADNIL
jgi:anti-sigma factor RsiW